MKALVCTRLSDDLSGLELQDVPMPEIGPEEVLLKLHAASINFPDVLLCQGRYQLKLDPPFVPGMDISGEITALGEAVTGFAIGDHVVGGVRFGGFADYVAAPAKTLRKKPERFSHAEAAAYPAAYMTAYVALVCRAQLQPGETLLVHGASGGVGLAAVDIGKLVGATVIATGGNEAKLEQVKAYGADHVLPTQNGFKDKVKALTDGRGANVIYDAVGGDIFDESVRCIAFDGRLIVIGFTSGRIATLPTNMALIKGFSLLGVRAGEYARQFPDKGQAALNQIWEWAAQGKTKPRIHAECPLSEGVSGMNMLLNREVVGKVVLRPD